MKLKIAVLILALILSAGCASASPLFHGNYTRAGNFSATSIIIPSVKWKTDLTGLVDASPVYYNGKIFVENWYGWGTWSPGLYCLNATNGNVIWVNSSITGASSVAVLGNEVVVGSLSGYLYYVNITNGHIIKKIKLENNPSWWGIASSPLVYNNYVYVVTFSNGTLWKLDSNGNIVWKRTTGGSLSHYTSPAAYNGMIFFVGNNSSNNYKPTLYAVYENNTVAWTFVADSAIENTPSVGYGKVFFATDNYLYAVYINNGTQAWRVRLNGTISTAALAYGNVYIGSRDGKLYCINASTGRVIWTYTANGKIDSSPAVAAGYVYFATNTPEGTIYALDAHTGVMKWYYKLTPPTGYYYNIMSSPFVADNKLFIGTDSGYVYCFNATGWVSVNVTLYPGTVTVKASGVSYTVNRTSALGALYVASQGGQAKGAIIGFNFTLSNAWYAQYGSLYLTSIFGVAQTSTEWWMYQVNSVSPSVGINQYQLSNGDVVYFMYGSSYPLTPSNAKVVLRINATVEPVGISHFTVSSARIAGNATAWVNVTVTNSGWYVLVVSGTNSNGDYIVGLSTFYAQANKEIKVPVMIPVPQYVHAGTYTLYAGIYPFNQYPNVLLGRSSTGVQCGVS